MFFPSWHAIEKREDQLMEKHDIRVTRGMIEARASMMIREDMEDTRARIMAPRGGRSSVLESPHAFFDHKPRRVPISRVSKKALLRVEDGKIIDRGRVKANDIMLIVAAAGIVVFIYLWKNAR